MPFVIIAAVIAIICVARYYHNKKERNKEITWQEVQKQTDTKRNTISIDTSEIFRKAKMFLQEKSIQERSISGKLLTLQTDMLSSTLKQQG